MGRNYPDEHQDLSLIHISLVTMDGYGYIKKLGEGELLSLNPKYKPIHMTEDLRINGKVLGLFNPDWFG